MKEVYFVLINVQHHKKKNDQAVALRGKNYLNIRRLDKRQNWELKTLAKFFRIFLGTFAFLK